YRRSPGPDGIEVHLLEHLAVVVHTTAGDHFEPLEERARLGPAMGLDDAHHHVDAVTREQLRRLQHGVGLPDARRGSHEHLEARAFFAGGGLEQRIRRRTSVDLVGAARHDVTILSLRSGRYQRRRHQTRRPAGACRRDDGTVPSRTDYASATVTSSGYAGMPNSGTSRPSSSTSLATRMLLMALTALNTTKVMPNAHATQTVEPRSWHRNWLVSP